MVTTYYKDKSTRLTLSESDDRLRDIKCPKCGYVGLWYEYRDIVYPIKCGHCCYEAPKTNQGYIG